MEISIIETRTAPTVQVQIDGKKIVFHSRYDPIKEAKDWARNALKLIDSSKQHIVIGLAAGYHLQALSAAAKDTKIIVLEFNNNYFNWFISSLFYEIVNQLPNVELYNVKNINEKQREDIFNNLYSNDILIQKNALEIFPKEYGEIKEIIKEINVQQFSFLNQFDNIERNFEANLAMRDKGIKIWQNFYESRPMILVSAGPSLDKQLSLLKRISFERKIRIGSVGTAVKPLLKQEIVPDFIMISDPNRGTFPQLEGVDLVNTPLFYLSTAYSETIAAYQGPRYIVFQNGYDKAENMSALKNEPLIQTGGSVSTTLLDLMRYLGASDVGLVGQDLAFTDGLTHAHFTPLQRTITNEANLIQVLDYYQQKLVYTSKNLMIYKKWFERYAAQQPKMHLYNCTEGGAFIKNWKHLSLNEFNNSFSKENSRKD